MKIKFVKPDPRAGTVVQLDSSLSQRFIDEGRAKEVSDKGEDVEAKAIVSAPANKAEPRAPLNKSGKTGK